MAKEKSKKEVVEKEVVAEVKTNDIGEKFINEPLGPAKQE